MASLFRAVGLTLQDTGFMKLNIFFAPMLAGAHITMTSWLAAPISATVVDALPVPIEKVPFFVMSVMPVVAVMCAIVAIFGISIMAQNGYESQRSRQQKAPGALAASGLPAWLDRVQGAQYNTWEACIHMTVAFFVAVNLKFPPLLFAKLATLFLALRLVYPFVYALDIDLLRTQFWLTGLYVLCMISFGQLFPETIMPLLGEN